MRVAILVGGKGRGSNMKAILDACKKGRIDATAALVIAPNEDIPAVEIARSYGTDVAILNPGDAHFAEELVMILEVERIDLLCLAGYMRLLPSEVVRAMEGKMLNIHPALLPKFGGKGMYGMKVHEAVIAAGEKESGATVHFVNEDYDDGDILLQLRCPVDPDDTPESLAAKVLFLEHECYIKAIRDWIASRRQAGLNASI